MSDSRIQLYADAEALARASATAILALANEAIAQRGVFSFALAGGSTPKKLYALLATDPAFKDFPWDKTHLFFGDERHVPPDHADSNYLMVEKSLLGSGLVPAANVHRVKAELPDAELAAADYEATLHGFFGPKLRAGGFPRFDLILLGMGPDGHTASLFPGTTGLEEKQRWIISNWVEKFKTHRVTFTYPVLNAARAVHLLVAGADKADMLHEVLVEKADQVAYPVQGVKPVAGAKVWLLDEAAAAKLPKSLL